MAIASPRIRYDSPMAEPAHRRRRLLRVGNVAFVVALLSFAVWFISLTSSVAYASPRGWLVGLGGGSFAIVMKYPRGLQAIGWFVRGPAGYVDWVPSFRDTSQYAWPVVIWDIQLIVPLWIPSLCFLLVGIVAVRRLERIDSPLCPTCGYDLSATAASLPCPECGKVRIIAKDH
jgi:hypothetical protein